MLPVDFYTRKNLQQIFFGGRVPHFPNRKNGGFPITSYPYPMQRGETLLTLSERLFGTNNDNWMLMGDANTTRHPDDWQSGDTIQIPNQVVTDNPIFNEILAYTPTPVFPPRKATFPIITAPVCPVVTGLTLNTSSVGSLMATWTPVVGAQYYLWQYRITGSGVWGPLTVAITNTITLSGLEVGTEYDFQVQVQCSLGGQSGFVGASATIGNYPACAVLSGLLVQTATDTTLSGVFTDSAPGVAPEIGYILQYQAVGAGSWMIKYLTTTAWTLNGLTPGTTYNIQVARQCSYQGNKYASAFTGTTQVTTYAACGIATALTVTNIGNLSVAFSWTAGAGAINYTVNLLDSTGSIILQTQIVTAPNAAFAGLTAATQYVLQVITNCVHSSAPPASLNIITNALACPVPIILALVEAPGLVGPPLAHQIQVRVQGSPEAISFNYYINGTLVLNSPYADVTLSLADASWVLVNATIGIQAVCGTNSASAIVTQVLTFTQPSPGITCPIPAGSIVNITGTTFGVNYTIMGSNVTGIRIQYRVTGTIPFTNLDFNPLPGNPITVSGLVPGTSYDVQIVTICTDGEGNITYSTPTPLVAVTLVTACPLPPFLDITPVGNTTATASWNAPTKAVPAGGVSGYVLKLINTDTNTVISTITLANNVFTYNYSGLTLGTNYTLQIQTTCTDGSASAFCQPFPFATTVIPGDNGGGGGGDITY